MTIRELKLILRDSNAVYKNQKNDKRNPDFRLTIMFEASKHRARKNTTSIEVPRDSLFDLFKREKKVSQDEICIAFLNCIEYAGATIFNDSGNRQGLFRKETGSFSFVSSEREENNSPIWVY